MWVLGNCHRQVLRTRCICAGVVVVPLVVEPVLCFLAQWFQRGADLQETPPPPVSRGAGQLPVQ